MTIASSVRKAGPFTGNDTTTVFPFAFKVFSSTDIYVVKLDVATDIEQVLTLTTDYTVSLNADQNTNPGGSVTLPAALATGYKLTITSSLDYLQPADITNQGGFYPSVIGNALDRLTIFAQQLNESISRTLKLAVSTESGVETTLPAPAASKLIGWNSAGNNLQNYDAATFASLAAYGTSHADMFSGDGVTTSFALTANPAAQNNLDVSIGGVTQRPGIDYSWTAGTTITFLAAPPSGTNNILVRYLQGLPQLQTNPDLASTSDITKGAALIGQSIQVVSSYANLRLIPPTTTRNIRIVSGSGGIDGDFYAVTGAAEGTYVDNGGTIIVPTGGDGSAAWLRVYSGILDIRVFGITGTEDTTALNNALSVAREVFIPPGVTVAISSDVFVPRYTKIIGAAIVGQATANAASSIYSSNGSGLVLDSPQTQLENLIIETTLKPAGSIGVQIGDNLSYSSYVNLKNVTVRGFETGFLFENSFFTELDQVNVYGCQTGIKINPTAFVGDGGYVTTIRLKNVYVSTCDRQGIYDLSSIQSKQMSFRDVIVEQCGDATYPQVQLASGQSFVWDGGYIESGAATKPHGIVAVRGTFRNLYINGANTGFEGGASSCNVLLENVLFTGTTLSFNATGGANANIEFDNVQFDTAPNVSAGKVFYTNCSGTLPANVTANSLTLGGTLPLLNVGTNANSNIRSIKYYTFTENTLVAANSSAIGALQFVASGAITNSVVMAFPTTQYPDGIQGHAYAVDTDRFRMKYTNSTGTPQTVTSGFICCIIKFA